MCMAANTQKYNLLNTVRHCARAPRPLRVRFRLESTTIQYRRLMRDQTMLNVQLNKAQIINFE
jgi:hypothetical protein